MLPTICQTCGGRIKPVREARTLENPNICASCAEAWDDPELATTKREPSFHALGPPDPLHDDHLQEVI